MDENLLDQVSFLADEVQRPLATAASRQQHQHRLPPNSAPDGNLLLHETNAVSDAFLDASPYPDPYPDPYSISYQGSGGFPGLGSDISVAGFSSHLRTSAVWPPQQARNTGIDEFFAKNRAYRPPAPCNYCRRLRLQCLILQTTAANPNPVTSCSSCVALFRDCSLAERGKRQASAFETSLPVINHLHGVSEEGNPRGNVQGENAAVDQQEPLLATAYSSASAPTLSYRSTSSRSVKKTRVLKNWFASHLDHPYPDEEEKTLLAERSGLTKTQVINWFANARRRHRLAAQSNLNNGNRIFLRGSPMPQPLLMGMSPMDRWKHSPPQEEPVAESVIQKAIFHQPDANGFLQNFDSYPAEVPPSSTSGDSRLYNASMFHDASSNSGSSTFSMYHSDDAGLFPLSAQRSGHGDQDAGPSTNTANRHKTHTFQCTFCLQSFKKKYDWVRHERSIHLPGIDAWICGVPLPKDQSSLVWRINHDEPECIFCGQSFPTEQHIQSHEFHACAERPVSERTFTRKDHLWQHLHKFHRCRKWEGWKPDLHLLQRRQERFESRCGFCQLDMHSWEERVQHLVSHFRQGATMAEWIGGSGIKDGRGDGGAMTSTMGQRGELQSGGEAGSLSLFSNVASNGNWP